MNKGILGKKLGMTQLFTEEGTVIPVTVIEAGPCVVTQIKTQDKDGYNAVQVGYGEIREKLVNKPLKGHFDKADVSYRRYVREFLFDNVEDYEIGQEINVDTFEEGDRVDIVGRSKGKGFAGNIKDGHSRGLMSHGFAIQGTRCYECRWFTCKGVKTKLPIEWQHPHYCAELEILR